MTESLVINNTLTSGSLTGSAGIFGNGFAANTNNQISNNHAADYEFGIIDGTTNDVVLANTVDGNSVGIFSQGPPSKATSPTRTAWASKPNRPARRL